MLVEWGGVLVLTPPGTHTHTHTEMQLAPQLEMLPTTNKNSPPSLPLNLNDFFQLLCRNRKSLWELEQCLLTWTPPNSTAPLHTPWTGQCKNAQVCWRASVSFRSEHSVCPGATRLVHTGLIIPRQSRQMGSCKTLRKKARWDSAVQRRVLYVPHPEPFQTAEVSVGRLEFWCGLYSIKCSDYVFSSSLPAHSHHTKSHKQKSEAQQSSYKWK